MKNWNQSKLLKWAITLAMFLFGLFCFLKDRGYCEEYWNAGEEFGYEFPYPPVPVEYEYLYQDHISREFINLDNYCAKWVNPYDHVWEGDPRKIHNKTKAQERQEWKDAYDQHHFDAVRTYNDAYNRIWWLPNITLRQLGRDAWIAASAMAASKTPNQALVIAFSSMLTQYGLHCLDEWDYIQDKLYWSNFHFEKCVYYANLLNK